jgi:hypothetical protein
LSGSDGALGKSRFKGNGETIEINREVDGKQYFAWPWTLFGSWR